MAWYTYSLPLQSVTIASCANVFQLKSTGVAYEILRLELGQSGSATSAQYPVQIVRKSAAGDVVPATPILTSTAGPTSAMVASSSGTGTFTSTASFGTDSDILWRTGLNVLSPGLYLPVPEERFTIPGGGIVAVRFPIAVTSEVWEGSLVWREWK
jgi:hypothetical protein